MVHHRGIVFKYFVLATFAVLAICFFALPHQHIEQTPKRTHNTVTAQRHTLQQQLLHRDKVLYLQEEKTNPPVHKEYRPQDIEITEDIKQHDAPQPAALPSCSPKLRVSFVKIHKTGSGAIHNVLLSIALRYNLSVAIPHCNGNKLHYQIFPQVAKQEYLLNKAPLHNHHDYQMFFDHAVFDKKSQLEYMSRDTVFYTQLRHPYTQAESVFHHFGGVGKFGLTREVSPLAAFLQRSQSDYLLGSSRCYPTPYKAPVTQNFQAFTLGFRNAYQNNVTEFMPFLKQLDSELHFVGLLEYGDESSLLLKRKMCWHIRDVLHIHTHITKSHIIDASANITEIKREREKLHRERSKLDYVLYDFFKEKLLSELAKQDDDFYEELEEYKTLNSRFSELCDRMCDDFDGVSATDIITIRRMLQHGIDIPSSPFNSAFRVTYFDCLKLMSKEVIMKKVLKIQQYPDACNGENIIVEYGLSNDDCDFTNHVYPGYHIKHFKAKVLNKTACRGNFM